MNRLIQPILAFALLLLTSATLFAQTTYYYDGSGAVHLTASWGVNLDGTGANPPNFTSANQIFEFRNSSGTILTANWTVSGTGSKVVIGNGTDPFTLNTDAGNVLAATIDISNFGSLNITSTNTTGINFGTIGTPTTVTYGSDDDQSVRPASYNNLLLSKFIAPTRLRTASGAISVSGTLTVTNTVLVMGTNVLSGTFTTAGTGTITTANTSATPISAGRTWTQSVVFLGAGTQTIPEGTYANLRLETDATSRTRNAAGNITVNGNLDLFADGTSILTFALGTNQLIGASMTINDLGAGALTTRVISTTRPTLALPSGRTWPCVVQYNAAMDLIGGTYESLTIGTTGLKTATGDVVVNTTLTSTGALDMGSNELSGVFAQTGTGTITTAGTMPVGKTWSSTTINYNSGSSQTVAAGTYTNLNLSGGNRTLTGTLTVSGTLTTGAGTFTTTGSTLELNGTGAQTITITGQTALSLNNLSITNGTTKTFSNTGATITVNGDLDILSTTTLLVGTNRLTITNGSSALLGTGTLNTACLLTPNPISSGLVWPYTVVYSGATQEVSAGTYQNLTFTTAGNKTANGDITVNGTLTNAATLVMGSNQLLGAFTPAGAGTISTARATAAFPTGKTWTGTVTYLAAAAQEIIPATSYNNLTISGGASNIKTATSDLTVLGILSVATATILDMATFRILSVGTYTNTGTTRTQNTSANPIPSMPAPIVGTVEYNATGNQTIVPNTHTNLNISGGGDRNLIGTINVTGAFTASSGNIVGGTSEFRLTGGTQTIVLGATGAFNNFRCLGTGNKTITAGSGALIVNGELEILSPRSLVMNTNQLGGTLTTLAGTGTLTTTHIATVLPIPSGKTWPYIVSFSATGLTQTVPSGTYFHLNILTSTSTKTAGGDITVNNTINVNGNASTILDMSTHLLSLDPAATISGTGVIRTQNTSATPIPANRTWTQTILYNSTTDPQTVVSGTYLLGLNIAGEDRTIAGTIEVRGAFTANTAGVTYTTTGSTFNFTGNAQTLTFIVANPFSFNNVSFTTTSPTAIVKTIAGGGFDVNGTLNIGANVTVNMATFAMGGNPTSITGTGQLNTASFINPCLPEGETWPFVVNYNAAGTGTQSISGGTYNGLTLSITTTARTKQAIGDVTVNGDLTFVTTGTAALTLNMLTNDLIAGIDFAVLNSPATAIANLQTQATSLTPIPTGLTWPDFITVVYNNNVSTETQNVVAGTYVNLTCTGLGLKNAAGDITVNGVLNLGANQNDDRGQLEMTVDYDVYATGAYSSAGGYDPLNPTTTPANLADLRNNTHPFNNLDSRILTLGPIATVTGTGDVTGKIRRTAIASGQLYQFSNVNMQLTFDNTGGGDLPTQITVVHTRGARGLHADKTTGAVKRLYQVLKTGGTNPTLMTIRLPYTSDVNERNGATPAQTANFVIWDHHIPYPAVTPHEHGKTNQFNSGANHWIELTGHFVEYLANEGSTVFTKYWMMGTKVTTEPLWLGSITGGDWNNPSNWVSGFVPNDTTSVVIPDAGTTSNDPVLPGNVSVGTVEIQTGGILNAGSNKITINGKPATNGGRASWLNNGTFTSTGVVEFTAVDATLAGTTTFNDIEIADDASLIIQSDAQTTLTGSFILGTNAEFNAASNNNTFIYAGDAQTVVNPNATLLSGYSNLVIGGTGTTTLPSTLEITSGIELNKALDFTGNTIRFKGTGSKTISGTNYPASFGGIEIVGGAVVSPPANTVIGGTLTITDGVLNMDDKNLTLNGGYSGASGSGIRFNGTNTFTVAGAGSIGNLFFDQVTPGVSNRVANLVYNRASETITLGDTLEIVNEVTPTAGTLNANGRLKLISNAAGTARIASGTGSYITGNVTAQRFIPDVGGRGWRFLSSPVSGSTFADWQGEMFITGPGTGNVVGTLNSNGFDASQNNAHTVFSYDEPTPGPSSNGWVGPTSINDNIILGRGYRVFVRGDRSNTARLTSTNVPQNEVTLDLRGTVNTGNITLPVTHTVTPGGGVGIDGSNLVGNPYPSNYNWKSFFDDISTSKTNINPEIFLWNPVTKNYDGYNASGAGSGLGEMTSGIIPQGAAFWVQAINPGPTSLILTEAHKVATTGGDLFKTVDNSMFKLFMDGPNGVQDEMAVRYMNGATVNRDIYDLREMAGTISISAYGSDSIQLAITCRPLNVANNDTIRMNVSAANGTYTFRFANVEAIPVADQVFLIDNHTSQAINLNTTPSYSFSINSTIPTTTGNGRFYIVVANTNQVPVELLSFSARGNSAQQVELKWETASEINTSHFEIERSADGASFETLFAVKANGKAGKLTSYTQVDKAPYAVGYYRLKMVDKDGSYAHSAIRMVRFDNADIAASLKMYPVPASKSLTIELGETISSIRIHNAMGKEEYTSKVGTEQFVVPVETLAAGVYTIEIMTTTGVRVVERFVKE